MVVVFVFALLLPRALAAEPATATTPGTPPVTSSAPSVAPFVLKIEGRPVAFPYGRLVMTDQKKRWVELAESPIDCSGAALPRLPPTDYLVVAGFVSGDSGELDFLTVNTPLRAWSQPGAATLVLGETRAIGTITVKNANGIRGKGTFDVPICEGIYSTK